MKIFDCITFYQENFITNVRFEILNEYVDYFIICESKFNHIGEKKNLNFQLLNEKFKKKIIYLIYETPFPESNNPWQNQAIQREYILNNGESLSLGSSIPAESVVIDMTDFLINFSSPKIGMVLA